MDHGSRHRPVVELAGPHYLGANDSNILALAPKLIPIYCKKLSGSLAEQWLMDYRSDWRVYGGGKAPWPSRSDSRVTALFT